MRTKDNELVNRIKLYIEEQIDRRGRMPRGWNQYQFEKYIPMIKNGYPTDKEASYIRNRNLFYVCCSRPQKRLFIFISIPVDDVFRNYLENMVGKENIVTYKDFIEKGNRNI